MMKRLLFLAILLLPMFIMAENPKKVAVYVMGEDAGINRVLESKLVSAISRSEEFTAIERTAAFLSELSKEQGYQRTGAVDDSELSRLGKQFGVRYICVAAVSEAFNEKYLSARLIDVESAQVEYTASSSGAIYNLPTAINAAEAVSKELLSSLGRSRQSNSKKVAVYVVRNDAGRNIGRVLGDKLVAGFTNSGRYVAVERTNSFLQQLSKEQNYQRTGAVDDNDISRLGKQFGVQYVCIADVSDVFGEKYISARLIDVETAEVMNSYDVGGAINNMSICVRTANEIASNLSKGTFAEQAEFQRTEALRKEREERLAEQRRKEEAERAEKERVEALVNRNWWDLLDSRITRVNYKYDNGWYVGKRGAEGRDGLGLYYWKDGAIYFGHWEKGSRAGRGIYFNFSSGTIKNCPNGKVYVGEWKDSEMHGIGTVYDKDGKVIYYGKFRRGKPIEEYPTKGYYAKYTFQVVNYTSGNKYVGEMENGSRSGRGIFIWADGSSIAWYGKWSHGDRDGFGIELKGEGNTGITGTWSGDDRLSSYSY